MSGLWIDKNSIQYLNTASGVAFTATLLMDGVNVGIIENEGNGGDTHAHLTTNAAQSVINTAVKKGKHSLVEHLLNHLMDVAEGVA